MRLILALVLAFATLTSWNNLYGYMDSGVYRLPYAIFSAALIIAIGILVSRAKAPANATSLLTRTVRPDGHADPLLTLRAFAFFVVFMGHYFVSVSPVHNLQALLVTSNFVPLLAPPPWVGVWIFFTLSGYLMGKGFFTGRYALDDHGIWLFLRNRALRIVPVYVVAVLIVSALQYPQIFQPENLWMLIRIFAFDYNAAFAINPIGALWSVSTEVQFYLIAPFLAWMILKADARFGAARWWLPALVVIVGFGVRLAFLRATGRTINNPVLGNLDLFVGGMLLSLLLSGKGPRPSTGAVWMLPLGLALIAGFYAGLTIAASKTLYVGIFAAEFTVLAPSASALMALMVIGLFEMANLAWHDQKKSLSITLVKWLQPVGVLTYCLYIVHDPVLVTTRQMLPKDLYMSDNLLRLLIVIPIVGVLAIALNLIERAFERIKVNPKPLPLRL